MMLTEEWFVTVIPFRGEIKSEQVHFRVTCLNGEWRVLIMSPANVAINKHMRTQALHQPLNSKFPPKWKNSRCYLLKIMYVKV